LLIYDLITLSEPKLDYDYVKR